MEQIDRESGYYWTKALKESQWEVAWYDSDEKGWSVMWSWGIKQDNDLFEIDENRIMRDAERLERYLESKKTKV